MSLKKSNHITCPDCGHVYEIEQYVSFNLQEEDDGLNRILSDDWILHRCPQCSARAAVLGVLTFHDMVRKSMIFFFPKGFGSVDDYDQTITGAAIPEDYTIRTVYDSYANFKEKILILESGLDDLACEIYKQRIRKSRSFPDSVDARIVFDEMLIPKAAAFFIQGRKQEIVLFDQDEYESALASRSRYMPLKGFVVDRKIIQDREQGNKR